MDGGEVHRFVPFALARGAFAEGAEDDAIGFAAEFERVGGARAVRALRGDDRADRGDALRLVRHVVDDRTALRAIRAARELRAEEILEGEAARERDAGVAIVRVEHVLAADERHARARLHGFVAFGAHRDRDLALAVELKAARVDGALRQHVAEEIAEALRREVGRGCRALHERTIRRPQPRLRAQVGSRVFARNHQVQAIS